MDTPCEYMPLAVLDPNTVSMDDVVPTSLTGFTISGRPTHQASLKFNPSHQWYYYPKMTNDEVLVFKQHQCFKGVDDQPGAQYKTCFHTAIKDPKAPANAEPRKSCEFRVHAFIK